MAKDRIETAGDSEKRLAAPHMSHICSLAWKVPIREEASAAGEDWLAAVAAVAAVAALDFSADTDSEGKVKMATVDSVVLKAKDSEGADSALRLGGRDCGCCDLGSRIG